MNKEALIEGVLMELLSVVCDSRDFVLEQSPLLFQEILKYALIKNVTGVVFSALSIVLISWGACKFFKDVLADDEGWKFGVFLGAISVFIVALAILIETVFSTVKILIAPKMYLLSYLGLLGK